MSTQHCGTCPKSEAKILRNLHCTRLCTFVIVYMFSKPACSRMPYTIVGTALEISRAFGEFSSLCTRFVLFCFRSSMFRGHGELFSLFLLIRNPSTSLQVFRQVYVQRVPCDLPCRLSTVNSTTNKARATLRAASKLIAVQSDVVRRSSLHRGSTQPDEQSPPDPLIRISRKGCVSAHISLGHL